MVNWEIEEGSETPALFSFGWAKKHKPMHREEFEIAIVAAQKGDTKARDKIILGNIGLCGKTALYYFKKVGIPIEDLIHEGIIGMMRAIEKFDPTKGFQFSTYAIPWVQQAIQRAVNGKWQAVPLPQYLLCKDKRPEEGTYAKVSYFTSLKLAWDTQEEEPSENDIYDKLGHITLEEDESPTIQGIDTGMISKGLDSLAEHHPREAEILRRRFGIEDDNPETLEHIGETLHLTRERVRQLEARAKERLKLVLRRYAAPF